MSLGELSAFRDVLKRLASRAIELDPEEVLFLEGEDSAELYLIVSGSIEVLRAGHQVLVIEGAGKVVGEMSSIRGFRRSATARAAGPARLLAFEADRVGELLQAVPPLASRMIRMLTDRLANMNALYDGARERIDFLEKRNRVLLTELGRTDEIQVPEVFIDPDSDFPEAPRDPLEESSVLRPATQEYSLAELDLRPTAARDLDDVYGDPNDETVAAAAPPPADDLWTRLGATLLGQRLLDRTWRDLGDHFSTAALAGEWEVLPEEVEESLAPLVEAGLVVLGTDGGFFRLPDDRAVWEALNDRFGS